MLPKGISLLALRPLPHRRTERQYGEGQCTKCSTAKFLGASRDVMEGGGQVLAIGGGGEGTQESCGPCLQEARAKWHELDASLGRQWLACCACVPTAVLLMPHR